MSGSKGEWGGGGKGGKWIHVNKRRRCPICDHDSWCSISPDGAYCNCCRENNGSVKTKIADDGVTYYVHVLDPDAEPFERPESPDRSTSADRAEPEVLDQVYRALLAELQLTDAHRSILKERGLLSDEIKLYGYKSFPIENRWRIAKTLVERFGETVAHTIPGLVVETSKKDGGTYWTLKGAVGILIPLRASTGEIISLKVRRDDADDEFPKYTYVSSRSLGGPGAIPAIHSPVSDLPRDVVRVTEGEFKADVTTALSGVYTMSFPGVGSCLRAIPVMSDLGTVKRILVAFDSDFRSNKAVALAMVDFCRAIDGKNVEWAIESWSPLLEAKGIDDVWHAQLADQVKVIEGEAARTLLTELEERYRPPHKPTKAEIAAEIKAQKNRQKAAAIAEVRERTEKESVEPTAIVPIKAHRAQRPRISLSSYFALGDHPELANEALRLVRSTSSEKMLFDREKFWRYDDARGLWDDIDSGELWNEIKRCSGVPVGGPQGEPLRILSRDAKGAVDFASRDIARKGFFDEASSGIAFADCFVEVRDGCVVKGEQSASRRAIHGMPFAYDPTATAPKWEKYLSEIFSFATPEDRLARITLIEEWIGAVLLGDITKYALCLIMIGNDGNNGKSVLLYVMEELIRLVHPLAVQAISPKEWGSPHNLAKLDGCRLNSVNEMPDADIDTGEVFKAVVSGDPVNARLLYRDAFRMRPRAGHCFAANALPGTKDQSGGFWRRWGVITFERTFVGDEINMNLRQELVRDEMPGIVARVIAAAARLDARRKFLLPESSTAAKEQWKLESDQVRQFVIQCVRTKRQDIDELAEHLTGCRMGHVLDACKKRHDPELIDAQEAVSLATGGLDRNNMTSKRPQYETTPQFAFDAYWLWTKRSGHACLTSAKFYRRLHNVFSKMAEGEQKTEAERKNSYRFFPFRIVREWVDRRVVPMHG